MARCVNESADRLAIEGAREIARHEPIDDAYTAGELATRQEFQHNRLYRQSR
jgi:hypothetical protein